VNLHGGWSTHQRDGKRERQGGREGGRERERAQPLAGMLHVEGHWGFDASHSGVPAADHCRQQVCDVVEVHVVE
jgi:hypothetical protein